ncbi:hypothetical protein CLOP_g10815 [Closterium sp. NIES-67]|nr:hypothetical protein CLOP_g10815 [Closterium sp. NIES-67]
MVIVLEKELAAISMQPGDDVKPVLDKIKDTYARMAAAGSSVSQLQQCTKIISVLDNSWDNLIPTLNSQQDQWTPEWLRQQILQEDFRRRHQTKGKDYDEVFAPVGKGTTLRVLLAIAALLGWKIRQMDIVTAFLNGIILEEVYMKQPEGLDDGSGREEPTVVFCDNESAVKLAKNACLHGLTKHIRPKWHWVRRLLDKEVRLEIVKTHQQAADIFTKRLAEADHWKGMKLAGMSVH